jgi:outer membrane protein assembly factor BamD (BamD/ComL family)
MIQRMTPRFIYPLALGAAAAVLLVSCGSSKDDLPIMAGDTSGASSAGEGLYQQAKAADDAGKVNKAIKLYDDTATRYPFAPSSAQARFRQAELLQQKGEILDSFEAYQQLLTRFQGSGLYSTALDRQAGMAQSAADGEVKSGFLGIKSKLSLDKTVEMLGQVRDNAPRSRTASKAQFTVGQLYESKKKHKEAIAAYRQLVREQPEAPEAPEALFRVGDILVNQADQGNQNRATLDLAREAFNDYLMQYPGHSKNAEARRKISSLGSRDVERTFETAEFYNRTGQFESAKIYYRDVVKRSSYGKTHDAAKARLKELGE